MSTAISLTSSRVCSSPKRLARFARSPVQADGRSPKCFDRRHEAIYFKELVAPTSAQTKLSVLVVDQEGGRTQTGDCEGAISNPGELLTSLG